MNKKIRKIRIIFTFILVSVIFISGASAIYPKDYIREHAHNNATRNYSKLMPSYQNPSEIPKVQLNYINYTNLQSEIDNATERSIINLNPSFIYYGNARVNKSLTINCNGAIIMGGTNGIEVNGSYEVNILNCKLKNATNSGIYYHNGAYGSIENNSLENNYNGIHLYNSSNNSISNNTINSNQDNGIFLYIASSNLINNNTINKNKHHGIAIFKSYKLIIESNEILNNSANGVSLNYANDNVIKNNSIYYNKGWGIELYLSGNNQIFNNTVSLNYDGGIGLLYSDSNLISDNNASSNKGTGIDLLFSNKNLITTNLANSNNNNGIVLAYSNTNNLDENTLFYNNYQGIWLWDSSNNNTIINNNIFYNRRSAIRLENASNNNIVNNNTLVKNGLDGSYGYGIYLRDNISNTIISNNLISESSGILSAYGIRIKSSSNITIYANAIYNNEDHGIFSENSYYINLYNNTVKNNNGDGINLVNNSLVSIHYNSIYSNKGYGVYNYNSSNINATYNWWGGVPNADGSRVRAKVTYIPYACNLNFSYYCTKLPPPNTILEPENDSEWTNEEIINFEAFFNETPYIYEWTSSLEGYIGSGATINTSLSVGTHTITLTVTFNGNLIGIDNITVKIIQSKDWIINETEYHKDEVIVLNKNLIIKKSGSLKFDKVTLKMDSKYDGQYRIEVQEGGAFYINNSIITLGGDIIGDFNGNGRVDIGDAAKVAYMAVGKVQEDLKADFNNNNRVDMDDANKVANFLVGKIDSLSSTPEKSNKFIFIINKNATFELKNSELHNVGYSLRNEKNAGLLIYANNTLLKNNVITNNFIGIYLKSSNNLIINNTISSNKAYGLLLSESNNNTIINNIINSNTLDGINLESSNNNQISNNIVNYNYGSGISLVFSSKNKIKNNLATLNNEDGITSLSSDNNLIINNTLNSNQDIGIWFYLSNNNILNNNDLKNNYYDGVFLLSSNNNTGEFNQLYNNRDGIGLYESINNVITENNVSGNLDYGILLLSSSKNKIKNNIVNSNQNYGIYLLSSGKNTIINNNLSDNRDGIIINIDLMTLAPSDNNIIANNSANSNRGFGIASAIGTETNHNIITNNTANSNYWDGIYISGSNNTLINNTASSNNRHGIEIDSINSTILGNLANSNKNNGIYLVGNNSTIKENVALNNLDYDILVQGYYNNIIKNIACGVQGLGANTLESNVCFVEPKEWILGDIKPSIKESNFTITGYRDNLEIRKLDLPEFIYISLTLPKTLNKWEKLNFTLSLNSTALMPADYVQEPIIETRDLNYNFPVSFNVEPLKSNLTLKIKDRETNISLKNASIYIQELESTNKTDLNGIAIWKAIEPSVYTIEVKASGYPSKIETINLDSGVSKSEEILLSKAIATLSGIVTYNNTPLPNITLEINPPGGGTIVEYEILSNNTVMIKIYPEVEGIKVELRDENNTLIPNAIDYTDRRGVVWLGFGEINKTLLIYVNNKKATPLIGDGRKKVETNIVLPVKKSITTALTNGSGYFSLDLSLGNYELEIKEEGYATYKETINLTEKGVIKNISLSKLVELLIVTNKSGLQNKYGDISELINRLEKIKGSKLAYIEPNNYVSAKEQINKLITTYNAKNLLIVGGDSIIPFYRIEDPIPNPNSEFHESGNIAWNLLYPQYNTNGKVLTDDAYGDVIEGSDLRADIPVGRILGSSKEDLINLIDNSENMKKNSATLLSGTLVYGEDWTRDVADLIEGYLIKENVSSLYWGENIINPSNTLNLINSDIVFSATHTVPETWYTGAIGANSTFINAKNLNIYLDNNPLVITLGCHGALVLENMELKDSLTLAFIHYGASGYIGNTGFGIVSNEIKYSETFYSELIRRMLEPDLTIGEVLLNTKQATPFKSPLDKKINLETVFYGNPKNKLNSETNKIKGLQSKKLYLKASESNYFKETPFHRVREETDLSTTYTGKMISILEINKEFINNPENTYIINNTIVPYVALADLKLSENVVIKEIKINHKLSETELIKLDLPKLDLVGWLPNNTTYKDNISNETIVLNPNWTNIIWETLPEYEGGKLLKTKFIPLKPYNSTHYELYTKAFLELTYTKSLIQISELNISDKVVKMKVTLANQAQNPENIKLNLIIKRTNEEIVDTYTNYLDINATSLASTEFKLNTLESGSYIAYLEVIDANNNILDSKEKWFEVL